ncbi:MAG: DUF4834 family protein [Bacteroidales bacterium]|nr:DUF4834 family protein [Bacteroidales bacterium]
MEKFLTIIFWIIFTVYMFRLAFRYLFPWLIARYVKKMANRMQQQAYQGQNNQSQDEKVKVSYIREDEPKIDPDIGEYIDFEDIKDNEKPQ